MNIFRFVNKHSLDPCLIEDRLYLEKGRWFHWSQIQRVPLHIAALKKVYGDCFFLTIYFVGKILVRIGASVKGKSFVGCGEKKLESSIVSKGTCEIDLSKVQEGFLEIVLYALEESAVFAHEPAIFGKNVTLRDTLYGSLLPAVEKKIQPQCVLYDFLSPSYELCCEESLYYKFFEERESYPNQEDHIKFFEEHNCYCFGSYSYYCFDDQSVHLEKDSFVNLLTYFNAFSAVKWKKYTNVDQISIYLDFEGSAKADVIHLTEGSEVKVFASWKLEADHRTILELPLGSYPDTGILGLRIYAWRESVLYGGGYLTDAPETQAVHLGIGITTYRREKAVKTAVARFGKAIAEHPFYYDAIDITVVDNGQTLVPEDVPAANLIPNRNLGGTGGFMRNLIYYQDEGRCTHCLFMDDDAACEVGSLFRSMSFIRHAKDTALALGGAMLFENIQFLQWEKGAWFYGGCHPLNHKLDLRDFRNLLVNENESSKPIYGAWWFFFFPIAKVKQYTLPFFVRGDDIDFSYSNDFLITSLNGVSCWQQDFKTKENAMTAYLFLRSHVVHHLTIPQLKCSFITIWKILWGHFAAYNNSYLYGSAACVNLAIKHILQGPKFWEDNIVPTDILKKIKDLSGCEASVPLARRKIETLVYAEKNIKTQIFPVFLRKMSFYGHLMPKFMIRKTPHDMLYKWQMPNPNRVYMRTQVIMFDEINQRKTILRRNVGHYFKNLFQFVNLICHLFFSYKTLRDIYTKEQKVQRTRAFWKKQFDI